MSLEAAANHPTEVILCLSGNLQMVPAASWSKFWGDAQAM